MIFLLAAISLAAIAAHPRGAAATPYWTEADFRAAAGARARSLATDRRAPSLLLDERSAGERALLGQQDYMDLYIQAAAFVEPFQVASGPEFGGIREAEHLPNIIQTDNTSEAIWLWTRYWQLTGDTLYNQNVRDAFTYSLAFPAYNEEGGSFPSTGYYRMYNCGWAVFAEWFYRDATGDTTYKAYGDSCAQYVATRTLNRTGSAFDQYVNPHVLAWAAGNLWIVGNAQGRQDWMDAAAADGVKAKQWVDGEPSLLYNETWAMSGGATMWGILNSWFREHPESLGIWTAVMRDSLDAYASTGDFTNAWNGWYALGHHALWNHVQYDAARVRSLALSDTMIFEDGDADGGIAARPADTDSMDQTWVTNYLGFMALDPWIAVTAVEPIDAPGAAAAAVPVRLDGAFPNPFALETSVRFALDSPERVSVAVFDASGRRVRSLVDATLGGGPHVVRWDGRDDAGARTSGGIYLLRVAGSRGAASAKITLVR